MNELNFRSENVTDSDFDLFFGPHDESDVNFILGENDTMANVMFHAGVFPSVNQARKNGWNKEIPSGFSDRRIGKSKKRITILNLTEKE
jgi:hypothetical protein